MKKKILFTCLALSGLLAGQRLCAQDYDVEVDGIYYKYDTEKLVATVVNAPYDTPYAGDITIPTSFTRGRFTFNVTEVANAAFSNSKATSVKFESDGEHGVTAIGENAFSWCSSLTEVELPSTLTTLGKKAFYQCEALREITIPDSVTALNEYTFTGCTALETVYLPKTMPWAAIGRYAFNRCGITSITLPKGVRVTGIYAFSNCPRLKTVNFPDDWMYINTNMFSGCSSLSSITFPKSLKGILTGSLESCPLEKLTIPDSVNIFCWNALSYNSKLKELIFEDSENVIDLMETTVGYDDIPALETIYVGCNFKNAYDDFQPVALKNLTLGASVTSIPYSFGDALETIHCKIKNPSAVTEKFSSKVKANAKLYVPKGTYDYYCNANGWKNFFFIEEEEEETEKPVIMVTADDKTVEYGEEMPEFTYTVKGGTLEGEPALSTEAMKFSDVGQYPISVGRGSLTYDRLYFVNGTLTIEKAPLAVGVEDVTIVEGDDIPAFKLTYSGFKGAQTEAVLTTLPVAVTTATADSPAGTYPITVSGGDATNYSLSYTGGTLTIVKRKGDANGDSVIDVADIATVITVMAGGAGTDAASLRAADVNEDGVVDVADIANIISLMAAQARMQ